MSVDEIQTIEDLQHELKTLQGQLQAAHKRIDKLESQIDENAEAVDRLENDVTVTKASVPQQSKGKIENVMSVIEHAYDKRNGGRSGVKLPSGEVTAVIDGSKQTALRLIDEIGGKFDWAKAENPGGPNPKVLKVKLNQPLEERKERVARHYQ